MSDRKGTIWTRGVIKLSRFVSLLLAMWSDCFTLYTAKYTFIVFETDII